MFMQDLSEMLANAIAIFSIWKVMKEERREVKTMNGINDNSLSKSTLKQGY